MIDLHCHILPNLDDGPKSFTEGMQMANTAVKAGITHLFATPHHCNGKYKNIKSVILDGVNKFNRKLAEENIPLIVFPGQEIRIHRDIFSSLESDETLTLDDKGKYLLLELPPGEIPPYTQEMIYELLLKEIKPIIVHPERNMEFLENHNLLFEMVQEGALTQLTSGSIIGHFGRKIKSFSEKIIEHNLAHFIATDAHNVGARGFTLHEAYETISKTFGSHYTYYFMENAELILTERNLSIEEPIPIRKKLFKLF